MKAPRKKNCAMILDVWINLSKGLIMKLLKYCTQILSFGGSEDALIHCFKEKSTCSSGATKLKEALQILPDESLEEKFFANPTDSGFEDARQPLHML